MPDPSENPTQGYLSGTYKIVCTVYAAGTVGWYLTHEPAYSDGHCRRVLLRGTAHLPSDRLEDVSVSDMYDLVLSQVAEG